MPLKAGCEIWVALIRCAFWYLKIKHAYPKPPLTIVSSTVTRTDHHRFFGLFLGAEVDHYVCDRYVSIHLIGARPEHQVAGAKLLQCKGVAVSAQHRMEVTVFAHPEILVTRLARNIFVAGAGEGIVNEPRAIHSSAIWVRRTISIGQIPLGQSKRRPDEFLDLWRLAIEFAQMFR